MLLTYEKCDFWKEHGCVWLATYDDRGPVRKILAFFKALVLAVCLIPRRDIVHIHASYRTSFCRKTVFVLLAKCFRKKTILHLHAPDSHAFDKGLMNRLARRVFSCVDVVIALSEFWAKQVRRLSPSASVLVIPNPCPKPDGETLPQQERDPSVIYVGNLEPRKGYADLLKAMPLVLAAFPEAGVMFAGAGQIDAARQLTEELGINQRVQFLGWVEADEVHRALAHAGVFCLPSYGEGVPMAMLEAMAHHIPVVVTPVGGIRDVIVDGQNGLLVTPGRVSEIAAAIVRVLGDFEFARTLSATAYDTVHSNFSLDVICNQVTELYKELGRAP